MSNVKPGNYSVSVNFLPWKKDKPINNIGFDSKKRKKTLRPIIHPIFEKCIALTEDPFWISIFNDCSRGKFPRGFNFKNNILLYKKGNKVTKAEITDSISEVFFTTMEFFRISGGIMSVSDRQKMKENEEKKLLEKLETKKEYSWKEIKTEKIKEILINEFINKLAKNLDFNEEEKKDLTTTVKKGFLLKYFNSNNVKMSGFQIVEIEGLIYNEENNEYEIDSNYMNERKTKKEITTLGIEKTEKKTELNFLFLWEKYLESLENKKTKKSNTYSSSYVLNESEESISRTFDNSFTS